MRQVTEPKVVISNLAAYVPRARKKRLEQAEPRLAFRNLSLELSGGTIAVLVGPPGTSSALARVIVGLDSPPEGTVHSVGRVASFAKGRSRIMVDQSIAATIVREGRLRGIPRKLTLMTLDRIVETAGFEGPVTTRWSEIDHASQDKLLVAAMVCSLAPILVLDGVLPHLDHAFSVACAGRLQERAKAGLLTIVASGTGGLERVQSDPSLPPEFIVMRFRAGRMRRITGPFWLDGVPFTVVDLAAGAPAAPLHLDEDDDDEDEDVIEDRAMGEPSQPIEVIGVRIVQSGETVKEARDDVPLSIELELEVRRPGSIGCGVTLFSGKNEVLRAEAPPRSVETGRAIAKLELPPSSMAPGRYRVAVDAIISADGAEWLWSKKRGTRLIVNGVGGDGSERLAMGWETPEL